MILYDYIYYKNVNVNGSRWAWAFEARELAAPSVDRLQHPERPGGLEPRGQPALRLAASQGPRLLHGPATRGDVNDIVIYICILLYTSYIEAYGL